MSSQAPNDPGQAPTLLWGRVFSSHHFHFPLEQKKAKLQERAFCTSLRQAAGCCTMRGVFLLAVLSAFVASSSAQDDCAVVKAQCAESCAVKNMTAVSNWCTVTPVGVLHGCICAAVSPCPSKAPSCLPCISLHLAPRCWGTARPEHFGRWCLLRGQAPCRVAASGRRCRCGRDGRDGHLQ